MKYLFLLIALIFVSCGSPEIDKMPNLDNIKMPKRESSKIVVYDVKGDAGAVSIFAKVEGGTVSQKVNLPWRREFRCTYCTLFLSVCKLTEDTPTRSNITVDITINGKVVGTHDRRRDNCVEVSYTM